VHNQFGNEHVRWIRNLLGGRLHGSRATEAGVRSGRFWAWPRLPGLSVCRAAASWISRLVLPLLPYVALDWIGFSGMLFP